jgi:uracil-DNA glycosylase family protein
VKSPFSKGKPYLRQHARARRGANPPAGGIRLGLGLCGHTSAVTAGGETESGAAYVPESPTLEQLREAAAGCKGCHLWERATQTVFGEGSDAARLLLVGEQPGDQEDLAGKPFVGPAGKLLDRALEEAGIDRADAYVTNVVKHFKWQARGKRRIHAKPTWSETAACLPWLDAELAIVRPRVLVCLGATAAQAVIGRDFRVSRQRGELVDSPLAPYVTATIHPSAILRQRDGESRRAELEAFVSDLRKVAGLLAA